MIARMETAHYKQKLQEELATVTEELQTLGVQNPDNAEDWVATPTDTETGEADENVSADHAEDLEERTAILADLEKKYNSILHALRKIETGTYGICEVSGEQIEEDRLDVNPAARTNKAHMEEEDTLPL